MKSLMILIFVLLSQGVLLSLIYKYPVKPGPKEWPTLKTEEERIAALQIPDSILSGMTTNELVQVRLNYPAYQEYWT